MLGEHPGAAEAEVRERTLRRGGGGGDRFGLRRLRGGPAGDLAPESEAHEEEGQKRDVELLHLGTPCSELLAECKKQPIIIAVFSVFVNICLLLAIKYVSPRKFAAPSIP